MRSGTRAALSGRIEDVHSRILEACRRAGREVSDVTLVAVTKTFPAETVIEAVACGLTDFGENRVQEAAAKIPDVLAAVATAPTFHLIGHLQTNKVATALAHFSVIHSVDSVRLLRRIAEKAAPATQPLPLMIEVNVSGEASKFGVEPAALGELLDAAADLPAVKVTGLMTVPPHVSEPSLARPFFAMLRRLAAEYGLRDLSMGMTEDFEVAIEEGATHVRVGRAIFGERES